MIPIKDNYPVHSAFLRESVEKINSSGPKPAQFTLARTETYITRDVQGISEKSISSYLIV